MSAKELWTQNLEKKMPESVQSCDGMNVLLSKNTWHPVVQDREKGIPVIGMHIKNDKGARRPNWQTMIEWARSNLEETIDKF